MIKQELFRKIIGLSVALNSDGTLIGADYENEVIKYFDPDGNVINEEPLEITNPEMFQFNANTKSISLDFSKSTNEGVYYSYGCMLTILEELETIVVPKEYNGVQVESVHLCAYATGYSYEAVKVSGIKKVVIPAGAREATNFGTHTKSDDFDLFLPSSVQVFRIAVSTLA